MKHSFFLLFSMFVLSTLRSQIEVKSSNDVTVGPSYATDMRFNVHNTNRNKGIHLHNAPNVRTSGQIIGMYNYLNQNKNLEKYGIYNVTYQNETSSAVHQSIKCDAYLYGTANHSAAVYGWSRVKSTSAGIKYGLYGSITADASGNGTGGRYSIYGKGGPGIYAGYFAGSIIVSGTIWNSSDRSLKEDIEDIESPVDKFTALQPRKYKLKADQDKVTHYGFIAQEIEQQFPEMVKLVESPGELITERRESEDGTPVDVVVGEEPSKLIKTVNYGELIPLMTKMIQEQQKTINDLTSRVEKLELK